MRLLKILAQGMSPEDACLYKIGTFKPLFSRMKRAGDRGYNKKRGDKEFLIGMAESMEGVGRSPKGYAHALESKLKAQGGSGGAVAEEVEETDDKKRKLRTRKKDLKSKRRNVTTAPVRDAGLKV